MRAHRTTQTMRRKREWGFPNAVGAHQFTPMTLTQRAECQMAHWRHAAALLPRPLQHEMRVSEGVRFLAAQWTDKLGRTLLSWEVADQHWDGTGVTMGLWEA